MGYSKNRPFVKVDVTGEVDKRFDEVTSRLAEKAERTYVDTQLQGVSLSYKESFPDLTALQTAYPTGDTYNHVTLADGMIYTWANNTWTNTNIQANGTGIADDTVTPLKLSENHLIANAKGKNFFDKSKVTPDKYVDPTDGLIKNAVGRYLSEKIYMGESVELTKTGGNIAMYDELGAFIGSSPYTEKQFMTVVGTSYLLMSINSSAELNTTQLELGSVETGYESGLPKINKELIVGFAEDVTSLVNANEKLKYPITYTDVVNKNLFNKMHVTPDKYVNYTNGNVGVAVGRYLLDTITLKPNTDYTKNTLGVIAFYDVDMVYISGFGYSTSTFTTPLSTKYANISVNSVGDLEKMQLEEGLSKTNYETGLPLIRYEQVKGLPKAGISFQNTLIVAKSGGDFDSLSEAITYIYTYYTIADTITNPITIFIMPGTWEASIQLTGGRAIALKGANQETTIVIDKTGDYYNAPVKMAGPINIEELTVVASIENMSVPEPSLKSYAVHHDFSGEGTSTIRRCNLISYADTALGVGLQQSQKLIIEDSYLYSDNRLGALVHNSESTATNQKLIMKDCRVISDYTAVLSLTDANNTTGTGDNRDTELTFINNVFYSTVNGTSGILSATSPMGNGQFGYMKLTGDSYGNNLPQLNAI